MLENVIWVDIFIYFVRGWLMNRWHRITSLFQCFSSHCSRVRKPGRCAIMPLPLFFLARIIFYFGDIIIKMSAKLVYDTYNRNSAHSNRRTTQFGIQQQSTRLKLISTGKAPQKVTWNKWDLFAALILVAMLVLTSLDDWLALNMLWGIRFSSSNRWMGEA